MVFILSLGFLVLAGGTILWLEEKFMVLLILFICSYLYYIGFDSCSIELPCVSLWFRAFRFYSYLPLLLLPSRLDSTTLISVGAAAKSTAAGYCDPCLTVYALGSTIPVSFKIIVLLGVSSTFCIIDPRLLRFGLSLSCLNSSFGWELPK